MKSVTPFQTGLKRSRNRKAPGGNPLLEGLDRFTCCCLARQDRLCPAIFESESVIRACARVFSNRENEWDYCLGLAGKVLLGEVPVPSEDEPDGRHRRCIMRALELRGIGPVDRDF